MVQQEKVKDDLRKMAASTETSGNHSNSRELETDGNKEDVSEETTSRLPEENELRSQQEYHTPESSATREVNDPNNERSSPPLIETQQDSAVANEATQTCHTKNCRYCKKRYCQCSCCRYPTSACFPANSKTPELHVYSANIGGT